MSHEDPTREDTLEEPPPIEGGSISGVVTDFEGVPLVGVRVEAATSGGGDLDLLPVLTDGEGCFRVEGLGEGRYDLRFVLGQVKARTLAVPVGTDQLRVRLARPQGILLDTRTEPGSTPPTVIHFVLHRNGNDRMIREHFGRTLKQSLLLWSIRPGLYTLTVWGGSFLPVRVHGIDVREGEPAPKVEVVFGAEGGTIEGQVVDPNGEPTVALVSWRRLDGVTHVPRHLTSHETEDNGHFALRGLPPGLYLVSALHPLHGIIDVEVPVEDESTHEITVEFSRPAQ